MTFSPAQRQTLNWTALAAVAALLLLRLLAPVRTRTPAGWLRSPAFARRMTA